MNGLFYMTIIQSVSLTSLETDRIYCLKPPEEVPVQCENITVNGGYKYPFDEVCDQLEIYYDNQTVKEILDYTTLPIQDQCLNLTVKCLRRRGSEICKRFGTVSDASSLSDPGKPKQQLNNTSEPADTDSVKTAVSVGVPLAVVLLLLVPLAVWLCRRKKKQTVRTEDGALPEQTAAQPEAQSLLSGTSRFRPGAFSADYSAATDDVTVTMPDAFGGKTRLNGDCKD
ncbi:uncharacterized protein LOC130371548 [Gadus chalcogrammus]|uniref:uncharacterized protein LOC130371548 n=1 Tax=Gadus chalcogrammus TaxID=1042646 RepID=UPI0024C3B307|nr:uncharacterized protein LOC130371548 [Gadus chalcogrammus]